MSRKLKTKYPCRVCGEPAEVASRKLIDRAICEPCLARDEAYRRVNWSQRIALEEFRAVNGKVSDVVVLLRGILKACDGFAKSAELTLAALAHTPERERRRMVRAAKARAGWAEEKLRQCRAFFDEAEESQPVESVRLVASQEVPEDSPVDTAHPALMLVVGGPDENEARRNT